MSKSSQGTSCTPEGGCCPIGKVCSTAPPTCLDYDAPSCKGSGSPDPHCCGSQQPFCITNGLSQHQCGEKNTLRPSTSTKIPVKVSSGELCSLNHVGLIPQRLHHPRAHESSPPQPQWSPSHRCFHLAFSCKFMRVENPFHVMT